MILFSNDSWSSNDASDWTGSNLKKTWYTLTQQNEALTSVGIMLVNVVDGSQASIQQWLKVLYLLGTRELIAFI